MIASLRRLRRTLFPFLRARLWPDADDDQSGEPGHIEVIDQRLSGRRAR